MFDLTGQVVLVTGGSRGIGRAIAVELARGGADVVVGYRVEGDAAEETVRQVEQAGASAIAMAGDVRDPADVERLATSAHRWRGRLSALVTSAGVFRGDPTLETGRSEWSEVTETDLAGTFWTIRACVPYLETEPTASVVTLSSILGSHPASGAVAYQAGKAAVEHMTGALALEFGPRIRFNSVAPGYIRTEMNAAGHTDPAFHARVARATPLGRWGEPDDVAPAVRFLLSDEARWITGTVLAVDGGLPCP